MMKCNMRKCRHKRYGDTEHCGNMSCDNYVNKCVVCGTIAR